MSMRLTRAALAIAVSTALVGGLTATASNAATLSEPSSVSVLTAAVPAATSNPEVAGLNVRDWQARLKVVGWWPYSVTGTRSASLTWRTKQWQLSVGLDNGGVLDTASWGKLVTASNNSPIVARPGDVYLTVREVQARLKVTGRWPYSVTTLYWSAMTTSLKYFQLAEGIPANGRLDQRTLAALRARTASPVIVSAGSTGDWVIETQTRLRKLGYYPYASNGYFSYGVRDAVKAFQNKQGMVINGVLDQRTYTALVRLTGPMDRFSLGLNPLLPKAFQLDKRCLTGARVMCINKTTRTLTYLESGVPKVIVWARFGAPETPTREGTFSVFAKYAYVISNLYGSPMPLSMFFSGGEAVHYSSGFARIGYAGYSHGCVNIKDYNTLQWIFNRVQLGDKVVVYH